MAVAPHVAAGLRFTTGRSSFVELEYRRLWMNGDYHRLSGGAVDVGADVYTIALGSTRFGAALPHRRKKQPK